MNQVFDVAAVTPLVFTGIVLLGAVVAGTVGALLGLGGGIILVPLLTLILKVDMHHAIAASLVSVIGTSCGSSPRFLSRGLVDLPSAETYEPITIVGAVCGAVLSLYMLPPRLLFVVFGSLAAVMACLFAKNLFTRGLQASSVTVSPFALRMAHLGMFVAGVTSSLLGIGSGTVKVPILRATTTLSLKSTTATSNFMMGATATAGVLVYTAHGSVVPFLAGPVCIGVLVGGFLGSRFAEVANPKLIGAALLCVMGWTAVKMIQRGLS